VLKIRRNGVLWLLFIQTLLLVVSAACIAGCSRRREPGDAFEHAQRALEQGNITAAAAEAEEGYKQFHDSGSAWSWQFAILRARLLHWRGQDEEVLHVIESEPAPPPSEDLDLQRKRLLGAAYASLHRFREAEQMLLEADQLCAHHRCTSCTQVISARGVLEMERGEYARAQDYFEQALASARTYDDEFWAASSLLNLSWSANEQAHFDNALDWANAARDTAVPRGFADFAQTALGNMGWAYYRLGDSEKARIMLGDAEGQAARLENTTDQLRWQTAGAYVSLDTGDVETAQRSFLRALDLAKGLRSPEDITNSLIALAFVSEQTGNLGEAKSYSDEAYAMAKADGNGRDQSYPLLVLGRLAWRQHDNSAAERAYRQVAVSTDAPDFLKWEAQRSLAHLYEDEKHADAAAREYRTALSTFEAARSGLRSEHSNLTFLSNATRIYDDYIHLLLSQGKIDEALQVADYDRGRTLREGLGLAKKGDQFAPEPLDAPDIARRAGGTVLFYWLGEKQSYVWVITPRATRLFPLNASSAEIDAAVHSYRVKLEGPPEILEASNDGSTLYKMLIGPAQDFLVHSPQNQEALAKNDRVFIIPDGSLNSLNFETLIPVETGTPAPKHYWIEDVTLTSAGSLRLLAAARPAPRQLAGKLLLMGDPIPPTGVDAYPRLPFAAQEVKAVGQRFAGTRDHELTAAQATPGAYLNGHPEQFSYIHFVAHGEASRTSPLDSAIILSRDPASKDAAGEDNSFKLYARDIVQSSLQHRLQAELVTISACYGAGKRSYSGEGLVGLSWAFLRAGAHNVVGALWDVSSISSAQLMDDFYGELQKGKSPSAALRAAKLKLLHSNQKEFRSPFYWAPFQLYTGS
jgi:CHAT domain-containing protein